MGAVAAPLAMQLEARRGRAQLLVLQPLGYTTSPLCPPEAVQLLLQPVVRVRVRVGVRVRLRLRVRVGVRVRVSLPADAAAAPERRAPPPAVGEGWG
eukprot:scaffold132682_cov39-Phaeocystis_antarctica.AAC.2